MTKGQPKCVAFFILVYIALVISRLIHTPHSSEHFLITRTPADSDFLITSRRFKITVYVKITERSIQGSDDQTAQPCHTTTV
jgi:hypothetical protein